MNPSVAPIPGAASGSQARSSSGSARSQRSANPDKQISQIEKSVTHLLVATKQLLETLTQWSRGQAQEEEVSDVYVRLGYEFNLACRAFNSIGVETSDLGPVPDLLRSILEDTLSQPASPQALDNYLPRIRDIIINLLHGLKRKQSRLRGRTVKDTGAGPQPRTGTLAGRQPSVSTTGSNETSLTNMLDEVPAGAANARAAIPQEHLTGLDQSLGPTTPQSELPSTRQAINRHSLRHEGAAPVIPPEPASSLPPAAPQSLPMPPPSSSYHETALSPPTSQAPFPHPPPPPPKQTDALARLQRGGDLERRASRRFSTYQISKHLGASPNGVPVIPPPQNSPIPNRGKEVRESLTAVRSRSSYQQARAKSLRHGEPSPSRSGTVRTPQRIVEERAETPVLDMNKIPEIRTTLEDPSLDSPTIKTPEEYHKPSRAAAAPVDKLAIGPTLDGPLGLPSDEYLLTTSPESPQAPPPPKHVAVAEPGADAQPDPDQRKPRQDVTPPQSQVMGLDSSPPQGKELTLFLQYKSKIKKFVLAEGYEELTLARLQLAFIEKFAWNTQHDRVDLPDIYVQDPVSGVRHELEDLSDVKDRCVLVLNVEALEVVQKQIDDGIGGLQKNLDGIRALLEGHGTMMQRFSDRQLETSKEVARMSAVPSQHPSRTPVLGSGAFAPTSSKSVSYLQEIQSLRRELAVLRQTYATMSSDFAAAMKDIKAKATQVKTVAAEAANASYTGDAGRAHINEGKKTISDDSEALVNRVDDLSDIVEELRKDVVTRGVRPLPRQLEDISKEISATAKQLSRAKDFVKREKPIWTKIWEQELQIVMTERDDLTQQDELMNDLDGDLEDITSVFKLVEEATKQQNLQAAGAGARQPTKNMAFDTDVDPHEAKSGVLDEVRALQPNHESRLEAIERAERVRQRELESRKVGEFQREVEKFVEEGKLKKTGGMDEVERRRKLKDDMSRRENWERQQARAADLQRKRAEEATAAAAASAPGTSTTDPADATGTHDTELDTSQEGEAFQDANEQNVQTPAAGSSPEPPATAPPSDTLPEIRDDDGKFLDQTSSPTTTTDHTNQKGIEGQEAKGSWWQPAFR